MPRVHIRTRRKVELKTPMTCSVCSKPVEVGDTYYTWARKMGRSGAVYYNHQDCGPPQRSQLSSRKTVAVEDAIDEANTAIQSWTPELAHAEPTYGDGYEDVATALQTVGEVAREVGAEYQDGFDNMPEGLNQGETAQAMEEVAQELESWADDLDSWSPSNDEPDIPERDEDEEDEAYRERCEAALEDWANDVRTDAEDAMGDMPEYSG